MIVSVLRQWPLAPRLASTVLLWFAADGNCKPSVNPDSKRDLNLNAAVGISMVARTPLILACLAAAVSAAPVAVHAHHGSSTSAVYKPGKAPKWPRNLQCVPYARYLSGIQIFGDAHTWWRQAKGKYARGSRPQVGAVMSFRPHRNSRLGHVAYVSKIVDSRNILVSHSNWSLINGRRGQIENNVPARDVSPNNDWSEVRLWYHGIQALGGTRWPLNGFIYKAKPGSAPKIAPQTRLASKSGSRVRHKVPSHSTGPVRIKSTKAFESAFADANEWLPSENFRKAFGSGFQP
jgi:surface antigen